jgi:hypothetical protein
MRRRRMWMSISMRRKWTRIDYRNPLNTNVRVRWIDGSSIGLFGVLQK